MYKIRSYFVFTVLSTLAIAGTLFGCANSGEDPKPAPALESLEIDQTPDTTVYSLGDPLDLTGIAVTGTYSDGSQKAVPVTVADCSGFSSDAYSSSREVILTIDGCSDSFTVHVIGDLVGTWGDGTDVHFTLNGDLTGSTAWCRGGSWTIDGYTLIMTYAETLNQDTDTWAAVSDAQPVHWWDVIVVDGKLRVSEPFFRIGEGTTLVDEWEQIAWHLDCNKVRLTIDAGGHAEYAIIPVISFDRLTGEGTWDYDSIQTVLTCDITLPLPACVPGSATTVEVLNSSDETIAPNGDHPVVFFGANEMDIDSAAWERME